MTEQRYALERTWMRLIISFMIVTLSLAVFWDVAITRKALDSGYEQYADPSTGKVIWKKAEPKNQKSQPSLNSSAPKKIQDQ